MAVRHEDEATDARQRAGFAVISGRWAELRPRLAAAGVGGRLVDDVTTSGVPVGMRAPLLLDTVGMAPHTLVPLLAVLCAPLLPTAALVTADDALGPQLCARCPSVALLTSDHDDLTLLAPWGTLLAHVERLPARLLLHLPQAQRPLPHERDPELLRLLATLLHAPSLDAAAAQLAVSRRTIYRQLHLARQRLGLPTGGLYARPDEHAHALLAALVAPRAAG